MSPLDPQPDYWAEALKREAAAQRLAARPTPRPRPTRAEWIKAGEAALVVAVVLVMVGGLLWAGLPS